MPSPRTAARSPPERGGLASASEGGTAVAFPPAPLHRSRNVGSVVVARKQVADDDADSEGGDRHDKSIVTADPVYGLPAASELLEETPSLNAGIVEDVFDAAGHLPGEILSPLAGVREAFPHRSEDIVNFRACHVESPCAAGRGAARSYSGERPPLDSATRGRARTPHAALPRGGRGRRPGGPRFRGPGAPRRGSLRPIRVVPHTARVRLRTLARRRAGRGQGRGADGRRGACEPRHAHRRDARRRARRGSLPPAPPLRTTAAPYPRPGESSLVAGEAALSLAGSLGRDDLFVVLLSGGGSSLLCAPAPGISLEDKSKTSGLLLAAGAPIADVNAVRAALSRVKGGRLAAAPAAADVVTLVLSDLGDDGWHLVASGPTLGWPTRPSEARAMLDRYRIAPLVPPSVRAHLSYGHEPAPTRPGGPRWSVLLADVRTALE